jgi:hypothetical protein
LSDFDGRFGQPFIQFTPAAFADVPDPINLCGQPDGRVWHTFQMKSHGNIVRAYALFQVIIFAALIALRNVQNYSVAYWLLIYFAVETAIFVLNGPTPLSPMGNLAASLVWRRRGPQVTLVPYKVVFGYYFWIFVGELIGMGSQGPNAFASVVGYASCRVCYLTPPFSPFCGCDPGPPQCLR